MAGPPLAEFLMHSGPITAANILPANRAGSPPTPPATSYNTTSPYRKESEHGVRKPTGSAKARRARNSSPGQGPPVSARDTAAARRRLRGRGRLVRTSREVWSVRGPSGQVPQGPPEKGHG